MIFTEVIGLMANFHALSPGELEARHKRFKTLVRDSLVESGAPVIYRNEQPLLIPNSYGAEDYRVPNADGELPAVHESYCFLSLVLPFDDQPDLVEAAMNRLPLAADFPHSAWRFTTHPGEANND